MQQPIQDSSGEGTVIVEDLGPLLEDAIRRHDHRPLFIAQADDLKEQIGSTLIDRQISNFINM